MSDDGPLGKWRREQRRQARQFAEVDPRLPRRGVTALAIILCHCGQRSAVVESWPGFGELVFFVPAHGKRYRVPIARCPVHGLFEPDRARVLQARDNARVKHKPVVVKRPQGNLLCCRSKLAPGRCGEREDPPKDSTLDISVMPGGLWCSPLMAEPLVKS